MKKKKNEQPKMDRKKAELKAESKGSIFRSNL